MEGKAARRARASSAPRPGGPKCLTRRPPFPPLPQPELAAAALAVLAALYLLLPRAKRVYLLSFACYKPPERMRVTRARFMELSHGCGAFDERAIEFQEKVRREEEGKMGMGDRREEKKKGRLGARPPSIPHPTTPPSLLTIR